MTELLLDAAGRRRSPATMPGFQGGRPPRNKGQRYPADPPTVEEIVAVMRAAGDGRHGCRLRGLIVVLWRAGLRIHEALALNESDLDHRRGALLVRRGKGAPAARPVAPHLQRRRGPAAVPEHRRLRHRVRCGRSAQPVARRRARTKRRPRRLPALNGFARIPWRPGRLGTALRRRRVLGRRRGRRPRAGNRAASRSDARGGRQCRRAHGLRPCQPPHRRRGQRRVRGTCRLAGRCVRVTAPVLTRRLCALQSRFRAALVQGWIRDELDQAAGPLDALDGVPE